MPAYNTQVPPPFLGRDYPLNRFLVFNAEAVTVGEFSQQLQISAGLASKGIRVELDFNANPGTFEIDVMESDSDAENGSLEYQQVPSGGQINSVTSGVNGASTHQSTDLIPVSGQFVCLYVKTAPTNANIKATARISRAA